MHNYTADSLSQNFINKKCGHNNRYLLDSDQHKKLSVKSEKNDFSAQKLHLTQKLLLGTKTSLDIKIYFSD